MTGAFLLVLLAAAPPAARGPFASRDEFLLAQPLLTLPPAGAEVPARGRTEVRLDLDWGNDFGVKADTLARRADLAFMVDGEHRSAAVTVRRGLGRGLAAGVRVPVHWRGGGWLDAVIDPFHDFFGFPDSGRSLYPRERLRVEGRTEERVPFEWTGRAGTGLGAVELELAKSVRGRRDRGPAVAAIARAALPTSTGAFGAAGGGIGAQLVASQPLGERFDLHAGAGATLLGASEMDGVGRERTRAHGFAALEWRPAAAWSALMQWEASSRLVTGVDRYPAFQLALRLGSKVDLSPRWRLEGGFLEGIKDLDGTVDFGVFAGLARRF